MTLTLELLFTTLVGSVVLREVRGSVVMREVSVLFDTFGDKGTPGGFKYTEMFFLRKYVSVKFTSDV